MKSKLTPILLICTFVVAGCNPAGTPLPPKYLTDKTGQPAGSEIPESGDEPSHPLASGEAKNNGQFRMLSWNVESEGADSEVIAEQLTEFNPNDHYDVFALTEVMPEDLKKFRDALGQHYNYAFSKSGRNDRLEILTTKTGLNWCAKWN